tara:strand:- start:1647 stop:1769 length:123 start_codon:yes stop_codon:yes gene_type:complete
MRFLIRVLLWPWKILIGRDLIAALRYLKTGEFNPDGEEAE